jgi:nucleoside-diphosphate-sugar epimerase
MEPATSNAAESATSSTPVNTVQTSEIMTYYRNKSIFITGATGFLGKVLVEKLLRSCYDLRKIYVLVRHKKGATPAQRLNELVNCKVTDQQSILIFINWLFK